jgi:superfamily II DNA or RNA helicase
VSARALRPYQELAVRNVGEAWSIHRSTLLVLATGLGKTFTAASILRERAKLGRILWIAHRRELISQAKDAIESIGVSCEIEMADSWASTEGGLFGQRCVIASVQTLQGKRLERWPADAFATIVIDEAHHATARSYRDILARFPEAKVLGLTATPDRGDKVGLGHVFEAVAFEYGIREGIKEGYLSPIVQKRIECADLDLSDIKTVAGDLAQGELERALTQDAVLHQIAGPLVRESGGRSTIIFTAGVDQAHAMVEVMGGYTSAPVAAIDGKTPDELRARHLNAFARGDLQFIFNCAVLTEGFDAPRTSCIAVARPTKSRALYTQMIGRGTRLFEGKSDCLVLDFVGNAGRHSLVSPLDVLAGKDIPDDVREAAERKAADGMPSEEALAEAEREAIERAEREEAKRRRAAKVRAATEYRAKIVDPFAMVGLDGMGESGPRATEKQLSYLEKMGITLDKTPSRNEASTLIDQWSARRRQGLCSYKQAKLLAKHGLPADLSFDAAREAIDAIAANGWRCPPELRARYQDVPEAAE